MKNDLSNCIHLYACSEVDMNRLRATVQLSLLTCHKDAAGTAAQNETSVSRQDKVLHSRCIWSPCQHKHGATPQLMGASAAVYDEFCLGYFANISCATTRHQLWQRWHRMRWLFYSGVRLCVPTGDCMRTGMVRTLIPFIQPWLSIF